jgi:hypothetical protein
MKTTILLARHFSPRFLSATSPPKRPHRRGAAAKKPQIEVCFVLDTTGSMGGLIEGAKQKIWSIANESHRRQADAQREVRADRLPGRGDEYVTRLTPLTDDIDASTPISENSRRPAAATARIREPGPR